MIRGIHADFYNGDNCRGFIAALINSFESGDRLYVSFIDTLSDSEEPPRLWQRSELAQTINTCRQPLFMELFVYPSGDGVPYDIPVDYGTFQASSCKTAVLFWDGGYFDIYVKAGDRAAVLYDLCKSHEPEALEYITEETDGRTVFRVL